jgi:hypothetical protein
MKQSEINLLCREAAEKFAKHQWALPPKPQWAATDFGLGDYKKAGLVEVLLANEREYCEKIMYARKDMATPAHTHGNKKEDIICRVGSLRVWLWAANPHEKKTTDPVTAQVNGERRTVQSGEPFLLEAGERITLTPGIWHEFAPASEYCLIGEVSTWCDEERDNFFADPKIDIFEATEQDEPVSLP